MVLLHLLSQTLHGLFYWLNHLYLFEPDDAGVFGPIDGPSLNMPSLWLRLWYVGTLDKDFQRVVLPAVYRFDE